MFSICKSDLTLSFMTEANNIPVTEDDLNTTAPNPQPDVWKMPEPVFRRTSGRLPQSFEKNYGSPSEDSGAAAADIDPPAANAENAELSTAHLEPKPKHPTVKIILVLLGLAAMVGFIVVFLTVLYFYFFR
jgi:hypothetical protein